MKRPTVIAASAALALLLVSAVPPVAAQEDVEPVGPPGSTLVEGTKWGPGQDPDAGTLFAYMDTVLFTNDEDWCTDLAWRLRLDSEAEEACLAYVTWAPFPGRGAVEAVVLPETWAVRLAQVAGWYSEDGEAPED